MISKYHYEMRNGEAYIFEHGNPTPIGAFADVRHAEMFVQLTTAGEDKFTEQLLNENQELVSRVAEMPWTVTELFERYHQ